MSLFERLTAAVVADAPRDLQPGDMGEAAALDAYPAAVLIAATEQENPGLILTLRRPDLRAHAGQIAFPGGRIDPGEDAVGAALREAQEEIGLDPDWVQVAGTLDSYRTITGFDVTPVLAVVPVGLELVPHEAEVADIFEAPLGHLLDPANHRLKSVLFEGRERHYYEIMWGERRIWGATAAMIVNLSKRLRWA